MKTILLPLVMLAVLCVGACQPTKPKPKAAPKGSATEDSATGDTKTTTPKETPKGAEQEPADADAKSAAAQTWDFEGAETGSLPKGWTAAKTGEAPGSEWQVLEDDSAPAGAKVLGQVSSEGPKPLFCLCIADETDYTDVDLSVALKGVKGKIDQGGGPMWRVQDENNYYVARMNPLEFNFRLYKIVDGKRTKLASADVEIPDDADEESDDPLLNKWHTIRVVHQGDKIQCFLNGKLSLELEDSSITKGGKVGLWAKADAVTSFDNLSVAAPSK